MPRGLLLPWPIPKTFGTTQHRFLRGSMITLSHMAAACLIIYRLSHKSQACTTHHLLDNCSTTAGLSEDCQAPSVWLKALHWQTAETPCNHGNDWQLFTTARNNPQGYPQYATMNSTTPRESCRTPQNPMETHGTLWKVMEQHGSSWKDMESSKRSIVVDYIILWEPWNIMETHGSPWKPIEPFGIFHEILMWKSI